MYTLNLLAALWMFERAQHDPYDAGMLRLMGWVNLAAFAIGMALDALVVMGG